MGVPKLHHYVPQFYLRRFVDPGGRLWVWDRSADRVFSTVPRSIAAETNFYFHSELVKHGHDPLTMEKQFAELEAEVSIITDQWIDWIRQGKSRNQLVIPDINRQIFSLFLSLQFLRTADVRSLLATTTSISEYPAGSEGERQLHLDFLWDDEVITTFVDHFARCAWIFGHNRTASPFITSDNPVAFRSADHRMWIKSDVLSRGAYVTYPLAPDIVMYCYPVDGPWHDSRIAHFDCQVSPVTFDEQLVQNDNSAQVYMASRFVVSSRAEFDFEREFAKTISAWLPYNPSRV